MFSGPRLKLKRAIQHIADLEAAVDAFSQPDGYRLWVEPDTNGVYYLKFKALKPLRCDASLVIGDAIHNLRSALDLAACEILAIAGQQPSQWANFPIRNTREELEPAIRNGEIRIAGNDIVELIVNVIKPYKGGNDALHALHNLDIVDKHRLLIPVMSFGGTSPITLRVGGSILEQFTTTLAYTDGTENCIFSDSIPFEIDVDCRPCLYMLFDKGQIFGGQNVVPTLYKLAQVVSGVLEAIEKVYLARAKP